MKWLKISTDVLPGERSNIGFFDNQGQVIQVNGAVKLDFESSKILCLP